MCEREKEIDRGGRVRQRGGEKMAREGGRERENAV